MSGSEDEHDLVARAAWLSFVGKQTHEAIAARLGLSRVKVTRLIARAQDAGMVKVTVAGRPSACVELEDALKTRFGLARCSVAPAWEDGLPLRALGVAGGAMLAKLIADSAVKVIGIGHGRTLAAAVTELPWARRADVTFVSVIGSLTRAAATDAFEVMYRLADRTGGTGRFLPAPYMCDSVEAKRAFFSQRSLGEVLDLGRRSDAVVLGVGAVTRDLHMVRSGMITEAEHAELLAAGAIGEVLGVFVDAAGRPVDAGVNERSVAIAWKDLRGKDVRAVAGGPGKARALRAVLRSGLLTGLVTDEATAARLAAAGGEGSLAAA